MQDPPTIQMATDFIQLENKQSSVRLGVQLARRAKEPVTAHFTVFTESNSSTQLAWLEPDTISWQPAEKGVKYVTLQVAESAGEALHVQLVAATNANIDGQQHTTTLAVDAAASLPQFAFDPNQVAYPGAPAAIPVRLTQGRQLQTSTVKYRLCVLEGGQGRAFLPTKSLVGFLYFDPGAVERSVAVPIAWDLVPPEAEYRLGEWVMGAVCMSSSMRGDL